MYVVTDTNAPSGATVAALVRASTALHGLSRRLR
jgi:hypothetical protein